MASWPHTDRPFRLLDHEGDLDVGGEPGSVDGTSSPVMSLYDLSRQQLLECLMLETVHGIAGRMAAVPRLEAQDFSPLDLQECII